MLTRDTMRNRYHKIPTHEPLSRVIEEALPAPRARIEDAWTRRESVERDVLVSDGLNELHANVVHGYLRHHEGLVPPDLAPRFPSQAVLSNTEIQYLPLRDPRLVLKTLDPETYCAVRRNQRQVVSSPARWLASVLSSEPARAVTRAGTLDASVFENTPLYGVVSVKLLRRILDACSEQGLARDMSPVPPTATLVNITGIEQILEGHDAVVWGLFSWQSISRRSRDTLSDIMVVIYAEYQRERYLQRAETLVAQLATMNAESSRQPESASAASGFDEAVGVVYCNLSESLRAAAAYGNIFSQNRDTNPGDALNCKRIERIDLLETLQEGAKGKFKDPGYCASWIKGHPRMRAIDSEIAKLDAAARRQFFSAGFRRGLATTS